MIMVIKKGIEKIEGIPEQEKKNRKRWKRQMKMKERYNDDAESN